MIGTSAHAIANDVLCCVELALANANCEPLQTSYVAAGQVSWDDCCGMLVVAPERVFRSIEFPTEATDRELCFGGDLVVSLVVLLVRCVPVVDDRGRAPSSQALNDSYKALLKDAAVVWDAVSCCDGLEKYERAAIGQTFVGATGGCVGVETRLMLGIEDQVWRVPS